MSEPIPREIQFINQKLIDEFGLDTSTGNPIWRVVFSDDQFEKRLMNVTDSGVSLLYPEVRLVPKYRQWVKSKWTLEQLVIIPDISMRELPTTKLSYEPMFPFEDKLGNPTQPTWPAVKFIVDTVYAAKGKSSLSVYKNPDGETGEEQMEATRKRVDGIVYDLFGDDTSISDHLSRQTGVVIDKTDYLAKKES